MRILFYSDNFYPEISGISDSIIELGRELISRGHAVAYAVPKYSRADYVAANRNPDDREFLKGFEVLRMPSFHYPGSPSGQAKIVVPLGWSIGFAKRFKPDIIHSQSPYGCGFEAIQAGKRLGVPVVGTNHTVIGEFLEMYGPRMFAKPADTFTFWYYKKMLNVSVPSQALIVEMRARGYEGPLEVVSNPLHVEVFSPATPEQKQALRKELGLFGPTVLFAGRLGKEKYVDVVIRAVARIKSQFPFMKLVITGNGPLERDLKDLARKLDISEDVIFTGFIDRDQLVKWYRAADVFALMCPVETQGLALMQAFAVGMPAAGVDAMAVGEHLKQGLGYAVPEGDDKALGEALAKILKDPVGAKAMGDKALAYVQKFSPKAVADIWEGIYKRFIR